MSNKKQNKSLIPQLRFPEFENTGEWQETPLINLAKKVRTKNKDGKIVKVLTNSAAQGIIDQKEYFDRKIVTKSNTTGYYIVKQGDYVYNPRVSIIAPVGPISKNKLDIGLVSPIYTVFRFKSIKNDFFEHFFKSTKWYSYLREVSNSGARYDRMNIGTDDFMNMPIPVPPTAKEQQKIADCLSSIDDLIEAEVEKLEALKTHKKGMLQQLFPAEGETVPQLRFPEFVDTEGWKEVKLIDITDKEVRWSFTGGPFGSNLKSSDYTIGSGVRVIQLQNIGDANFINNSKIFTSEEKADELLSCNIYPGDIIMSKMGDPVGRACLIPDFHERYVMCSDGIRIVVDEKKHDKYFIYSMINSLQFRSAIEVASTGSTRKRIGLDILKKLLLTVPNSKKEQKKIADCLSSLDELIKAQTEKIEALKTHKKGLLQQLFPSTDIEA